MEQVNRLQTIVSKNQWNWELRYLLSEFKFKTRIANITQILCIQILEFVSLYPTLYPNQQHFWSASALSLGPKVYWPQVLQDLFSVKIVQIEYSVFYYFNLLYFYIMDGVWVFIVLLLVIPLKQKDYHCPMVLHKKNGFFIQKISGKEQRKTQIRLCLPWTY